MRPLTVLASLLPFIGVSVFAAEPERSVDIFAWPLSSPKSSTLAKITFNSTAATVKSVSNPSIPPHDNVVRVGFYHPSGSWSGIATSASNFQNGKDKTLQLHVNSDGELYHVGFKASNYGTSSKSSNKKEGLSVEVVKVRPGPTPRLNKPVVLSPDGKAPETEPEKTFFQKYWWAIAGFLLLQVVLGAGKQE
ncbi:hypothetical protein Tdes44962_MAKER07954 [Teratosphaeria destructans]|uniref:Uncharacterized protein n=1 Tax=Teratosphaeria destructans TaxID=418781 RepID=A0A9W7SXT7_9PEZI|nr:hypothetical protein Tdes44962_MAKER07954 [Teratosphaeria destructans]